MQDRGEAEDSLELRDHLRNACGPPEQGAVGPIEPRFSRQYDMM